MSVTFNNSYKSLIINHMSNKGSKSKVILCSKPRMSNLFYVYFDVSGPDLYKDI